MKDLLSETAYKKFSISYIYPVQRYVIANVLDKINQIVVLPTAAGKSLCFQLPALFLNKITVVVVPLLALLKDQADRAQKAGIQVAPISGETDKNAIFKKIKNNKLKIIFITPESLISLDTKFKNVNIGHLVIDEAHCVTDWGDSFRPSYLKIGEFINQHNIDTVTAFTATASEKIINRIGETIFKGIPVSRLIENPDRPNIHYSVIKALSKSKEIIGAIATYKKPVILYTRSRKRAEYFAHLIQRRMKTDEVYFYHAGLTGKERNKVESWFMKSDNGILTATSAFGLGIDKKNVRTVIHAEVPYSVEAYLQESGRAGRDKKPGNAVLIYSYEDFNFIEKLNNKIQRERFKKILFYIKNIEKCRREILLSLLNYRMENRCTGCDICTGKYTSYAHGEKEILNFFKKNKRLYNLKSAVNLLHGKSTYQVNIEKLKYNNSFGLLNTWEKEDIVEGLNNLLETDKLYIPERGFFKYKVTVKKRQAPIEYKIHL